MAEWAAILLSTYILTQLLIILHKSLKDTLGILSLLLYALAAAWYRLSMADIPLLLGFRTIRGLSYQPLTATVHNDCTATVLLLTD
jgi:hypothetical protein